MFPPTEEQIRQFTSVVFPRRSVQATQLLTGGLINTNVRINFEGSHAPVVLRLYRDGADVCRKEQALHNLIADKVRVPKVLHTEPQGINGSPAFTVMEYIDGLTFQQLKRALDLKAINQAAYSVGQTLAAIGRIRFDKPGRLIVDESGELVVGAPFTEDTDPIPRLLDTFLASPSCKRRTGAKLFDQIHKFVWSWATKLPNLDQDCKLVHSDFGNRNILVREENGNWVVAAVLDWEFGFSGSHLLDVGHFLRYERVGRPLREPHFSRGFVEHGGELPDNWRDVVRVIDLTALVECLTHDDLPFQVEVELIELIMATIEQRDYR